MDTPHRSSCSSVSHKLESQEETEREHGGPERPRSAGANVTMATNTHSHAFTRADARFELKGYCSDVIQSTHTPHREENECVGDFRGFIAVNYRHLYVCRFSLKPSVSLIRLCVRSACKSLSGRIVWKEDWVWLSRHTKEFSRGRSTVFLPFHIIQQWLFLT